MIRLNLTYEEALQAIGEPINLLDWELTQETIDLEVQWVRLFLQGWINGSFTELPEWNFILVQANQDRSNIAIMKRYQEKLLKPLVDFCYKQIGKYHEEGFNDYEQLKATFKEAFRNAIEHGVNYSTAHGQVRTTGILGTNGIIIRLFQSTTGIPEPLVETALHKPETLTYKSEEGRKWQFDEDVIIERGNGLQQFALDQKTIVSFERSSEGFAVLLHQTWNDDRIKKYFELN